ncbi:MAG: lantibiotic dehydratase, partial [Blastocatellia bacterium]
ITIDRLVISRESWRFPLWGMEFAFEKEEADRFRGARRWATANNLPRFAFYKSPIEVKPCFLDFASPIFTTLFAKAIRNATDRACDDSEAAIVIAEMLPTPNDLWLKDAQNQCYTSELRFVTVAK